MEAKKAEVQTRSEDPTTVPPGSAPRLRIQAIVQNRLGAAALAQLPSKASQQFDLCVLAPIARGQLAELEDVLARIRSETIAQMQNQQVNSPLLDWSKLRGVHYGRFVIVPPRAGDQADGWLAFSTNYDGPMGEPQVRRKNAQEAHFDELIRGAEGALDSVFRCCQGYSGLNGLKDFLREHGISSRTFYVGSSGRLRDQILAEADLQVLVQELLDEIYQSSPALEPEEVRRRVAADPRVLKLKVPTFEAQPERAYKVTLLVLGSGALVVGLLGGLASGLLPLQLLSGGVIAAGASLAALLRYREKTDSEFKLSDLSSEERARANEHVAQVSVDENLFLQNELSHLVEMKPGWFRSALIELVFSALRFLAKNLYNKGKLGNIPSIHFARWCRIDGGRRLLFFSNFDNSWESYLGDFIDQASSGLTGVWSNTVGYPRSRWLINAGSKNADQFKAWTRFHQIRTQVWYSAYPNLSIRTVNANTEIRRGLADPSSMRASTWLDWLQGVDRRSADELHKQEKKNSTLRVSLKDKHRPTSTVAPLDLEDVQGLVVRGYGSKPCAEFVMLRVDPSRKDEARAFLARLPLTHAHGSKKTNDQDGFVNLAFTHRGLQHLGLGEELLNDFPTAYSQGALDLRRRRINGDLGEDGPEHWNWGNEENPVDVLLLVYESTAEQAKRRAKELVDEAQAAGMDHAITLEGGKLPGRKEHFGFRDQISQPAVLGVGKAEDSYNTINPGELLLGHKNGYDRIAHSPGQASGSDFGKNGSYLVFRQLEQDVSAFWKYCREQAERLGSDVVTVAAKIVGRWPSGAPLVKFPDGDPGGESDDDRFAYLANGARNDRAGTRCPLGSHLRRTNPRDWELGANRHESIELANLHRIIRRGRPYGPPLDADMAVSTLSSGEACDTEERGLHFLAFNADIERQFEFVQQQWLQNPAFAGLNSSHDPAAGNNAGKLCAGQPHFTIQADTNRSSFGRCLGLQDFVRVKGSAYFFMPSISTIRSLAK